MSEETFESRNVRSEERSRALFEDSVEGLDMGTRSRLTQARHAALAAAERSGAPPVVPAHCPCWARRPASPPRRCSAWRCGSGVRWVHHGQMSAADTPIEFEDLDIVAASDESSGDAMDMLQDDLDFYAWADKTASTDPTA